MSTNPAASGLAGKAAGRYSSRSARRRRGRAGGANIRPGWVTYLILGLVFLVAGIICWSRRNAVPGR